MRKPTESLKIRNTSKFYSTIRSGIPSQNQNLLLPRE
jgi:hypothetical protein